MQLHNSITFKVNLTLEYSLHLISCYSTHGFHIHTSVLSADVHGNGLYHDVKM